MPMSSSQKKSKPYDPLAYIGSWIDDENMNSGGFKSETIQKEKGGSDAKLDHQNNNRVQSMSLYRQDAELKLTTKLRWLQR